MMRPKTDSIENLSFSSGRLPVLHQALAVSAQAAAPWMVLILRGPVPSREGCRAQTSSLPWTCAGGAVASTAVNGSRMR